MTDKKAVLDVLEGSDQHWVGDGFRVRSLFSVQDAGERHSPFLLLDYAAPAEFPPTEKSRGVGPHPHRGFETVTIVYQGGVEHRDSVGNHGTIGPGDVQWMTAASGILHEEKHERAWAKQGGVMQMAQLWVNLPRKSKKHSPRYQTLMRAQIPVVALPNGAGTLRVIAGDFNGTRGAAETFTQINVFDVRLQAGKTASFDVPAEHNTTVVVLEGEVAVDDARTVGGGEVVLYAMRGERIELAARSDALVLVLSGEPIREPVVSYGPFVMNTDQEILQAVEDFNAGKMGRLV